MVFHITLDQLLDFDLLTKTVEKGPEERFGFFYDLFLLTAAESL